MAEDAIRDQNFVTSILLESSTNPGVTVRAKGDEVTGRLLVDLPGGSGTVTSVSVVTANGFAGTVANATTTPAITLTTSITGILQGNGTAISAITVGSGLSFAGGTLSATATGNVTKVGTPVNNQVGVWTGDGTIEGDVDFVFDTSTDTLTLGAVSGVGRLVAHAVVGDASDGLLVEANNGTDVGILGVGNTANVTWYGAHNFGGNVSPSTNDGASLGFSSNQWSDVFIAEGGVINWDNGDVTITQTNSVLAFAGASYTFDGNITPASNDGAALGSTTNQFSDLFLAEGGVINFDNGDMTLTQAGNTLTLAGGDLLLAENTSVALDPSLSADGTYTGITITGTAGYTQSFGDLVYLDPTDSRWEAADANAASGADGDARGMLGMVVVAGTDGTSCTVLLNGVIRADAKFPTFTVNNPIYVSETAGSVTQTQPVTTDVVIRLLGAAITSDSMYFSPDFTYITHT